jgi:hypothetical protein
MPDLHALWIWMSALKGSLPFALALPILVATAFATIADWVEDHLVRHQASQDQTDDAAWEHRSGGASRSEWVVSGDGLRNREST